MACQSRSGRAFRLPSILAVVGLKYSCIANFSELLIAYSAAGTASSRLCRALAVNARRLRYSGGPDLPVPCPQRALLMAALVRERRAGPVREHRQAMQ